MAKKTVSAAAQKIGPSKRLAKCGIHRKYKGIMPPRADCFVCQEIYRERNGGVVSEQGHGTETNNSPGK